MTPFALRIVTPGGLAYDGPAEEIVVRTVSGDLGVLAGHIPCVAPLGKGPCTILSGGQRRYAACTGGLLRVAREGVTLICASFAWTENVKR